jgi:hypothetical protein
MSNDDCPLGFAPSPPPAPGSGLTAVYQLSGCQLNETGQYCCPECPICFEVLGRGVSMQLACGHKMHQECFQASNTNGEGRCPVCRQTEEEAMRMWYIETSDDEQNVELEVDNEPLPEPEPEHLVRLRQLELHEGPEVVVVPQPEPEPEPEPEPIDTRDVILNGPCPVDMPAVFGTPGLFGLSFEWTPDRFENGRAVLANPHAHNPGRTRTLGTRAARAPLFGLPPREWTISEVVVEGDSFRQYVAQLTPSGDQVFLAREWW